MLRRLQAHSGRWDMLVVGGGATGVGVAIDAANRGYDVLRGTSFGQRAAWMRAAADILDAEIDAEQGALIF